jgi:four helix bundle protein
MSLKVLDLAHSVIVELRPLLPRIRRMDRSLADQLLRAANSMVLNLGEAEYSDVGTRRARFFTAAGSTNETRTALRLAAGWGYITAQQIEAPLRRLGQVQAILWKLSH